MPDTSSYPAASYNGPQRAGPLPPASFRPSAPREGILVLDLEAFVRAPPFPVAASVDKGSSLLFASDTHLQNGGAVSESLVFRDLHQC